MKVITGKVLFVSILVSSLAFAAKAQTTVTVDATTLTLGYMNWTPYPENNGGGVAGGGTWGIADLRSSFSGNTVTLLCNDINDTSAYWYVNGGAPGNPGGMQMDASLYNESTGVYVNQTLTFTGNVLANSLLSQTDSLGHGWTSVAFIKDFAPDYSSFTQVTAPLDSLGTFSISKLTSANVGDHIQYGFETVGPDVWQTDVGSFGSVIIAPVPEPTTLALAGLGGFLGFVFLRRLC